LAALFVCNAGNAPGKAQVPFWDAITELSNIYPEVSVPGADDVPYLEVSVKAIGMLGNRLDEIHYPFTEKVRGHLPVLIE
jgi:hypothetical protein